ncbi:MAG: hypothetical protein KIT72_10260 [Polyangiaceae bacterium]|nr:hypothetical protein [Polyangiaceae bacterium]MCW5790794.1 hypothetical protein [Polyangiaceae bacterium]
MPRPEASSSEDRRQHRSADPVIALGRLLDAARRRSGARSLAVADASGLLIAGAGHIQRCEELAALAAAEGWASASDGRARALGVRGMPVLLCAEGAGSQAAIDDASAGTVRILMSA